MAVKATATVTLSCYRDTQSVTRYYKLQSSTASAPLKPTTNPPTDWSDSEPSYTSGSTNTLYFCDLTVFSDGTWAYSTVSKSSSYEAAKEAYNKAQNADQKIDDVSNEIHQTIVDQNAEIIQKCESIILKAAESLVSTSDYEDFKSTVETQLSIMSDEIVAKFTETKSQIDTVNGELQTKFTELYKYISFSENGINIGGGENGINLQVDNDAGIIFSKNGVQFGYWDGVDFYTGNIVVEVNERAQFGNFAFIPRSDGSLSFLKVGG